MVVIICFLMDRPGEFITLESLYLLIQTNPEFQLSFPFLYNFFNNMG
jgi:hypothetical protein